MQKPQNTDTKLKKCIQMLMRSLIMLSFVFFVVAQFALPAENKLGTARYNVYDGQWVQILENGSRKEVQVPGQLENVQGEWVTIESQLSEDMQATWLCLRSLQQDFKIYVDDELREEYSTIESQLFGKTSTITYVWLKLTDRDAGKILRVEFMSDSFYSGYMEEILQGEKADIQSYLFGRYGLSALMAAFMFLVGLVIIITCQPYVPLFRFKGNGEMYSLGGIIMLASTWLLVESKLRQFIFPNSTVAMYMGFLMIMLLPYAFLSYVNQVQKRRYEKVYMYIMAWSLINFVACTGLQVFGIKDFFEAMTSSHIVLGVTVLSVLVTIVLDIKSREVLQYKSVVLGFSGILLAALMEIALSYTVNAKLNGVPLCLALICLVCVSGLKVGKEMTRIESEKQTAEAARKSQAQFLANMSHEIRTPINTILGMNEMILRENEDKAINGYAGHIKRAGHMLLGLINEILDFSKMEAGKLEIVSLEYSLSDVLEDIQTETGKRAGEKGLAFRTEISRNLPAVLKGDELRIRQILNNVLSNAVKYTKQGTVTLRVNRKAPDAGGEKEQCFLAIEIEDTGMGIREEDLPHLFDSFQRLEMEKNRHIQGTGLGLCITKQLVDCMGGTIEATSRYGEGTCFRIMIPQEIISESEVKKTEEERSVETGAFRAPDAHILAVDDNRVNLVVLRSLLKRTEIKVDLAMSGKQALECTRAKKYDLILMDHMMPEMDGIEALRALRGEKDNMNCDTKMIVLTANAIHGVEQEYKDAGFDDYISKPLDPELLEKVLRKYLEK